MIAHGLPSLVSDAMLDVIHKGVSITPRAARRRIH